MAVTISGTGSLSGSPSLAVSSNTLTVNGDYVSPFTGFKNRIINGAMMIDQRNAGASVTATSGNLYTLDRWVVYSSQASKFTLQQNAGSVTPPSGFANYLGITSSSAYTVGSTDLFVLQHKIEGFNSADLAWGTSSAATVTLSFWVRSSLTGTFGGSLSNSALTRSYSFSYTISSANTWEQKTITIAGDTAGTWLGATNGIGIRVQFSVGSGSTYNTTAGAWAAGEYYSATGATNVVSTNGATFYITGVQLEKGSTATSFDYRPYGTELALCQRYCVAGTALLGTGMISTAGHRADCVFFMPVAMRATPSISGTGKLVVLDTNLYYTTNTSTSFYNISYANNFVKYSLTNTTWAGGNSNTPIRTETAAANVELNGAISCEL